MLLITGARLGQMHGYRRMFLLGVGVFTGASLLCGLAPGPIALIAARASQGAGAALMFPQALSGIHPPAVSSGMLAVAAATSTYYGLLFTLALYLQQGLGRSALVSGFTLVSWVVAFGAAGQIVRRLPPRLGPLAAPAGCLLLAGAYLALSASLFAGRHAEALLVALLAAGGLGLGTQFSALIVHLTNAVAEGYAHDISGVTTTTTTIAGAIAIAAFGTAYLSLASAGSATHAFAIVTAAFAAIAALAALLAHGATRRAAVR